MELSAFVTVSCVTIPREFRLDAPLS